MRRLCAIVFVLCTALSFAPHRLVAQKADAAPARKPAATITRKGLIKSIDDTSISLTPSDNKKGTISFQLTSSVERSGNLVPGESVAVTYYLEDSRPVVIKLAAIGKK